MQYAEELLDEFEENHGRDGAPTKSALLNGAENWSEYSYGACSLIYDCEIAERLCPPSYLKRKRGGDLPPSKTKTWLDVQATALGQACRLILAATK